MAAGEEFLVAVGSGTLSDLAKYAGHMLGRPVLLFATAASMNGYTSPVAALTVAGVKRTLPCTPALGVFADPLVLADAPRQMTAAGVADALSKGTSTADWLTAHLLRNEYYCGRAREFSRAITDTLIAACPDVGAGHADAVQVVMEALLLTGLSMVIAGSSSPASGGEHLISHYLDMRHALYGVPNDLHGAQVGVATLDCLRLYDRLLRFEPDAFDVEAALDAQPSDDVVLQWLVEDWGQAAPEIIEQWRRKALGRAALRHELERFAANHERFCEMVRPELIPADTVARAIADAGGPTAPEQLSTPLETYHRALERARFIRDRLTVLDLAAALLVNERLSPKLPPKCC